MAVGLARKMATGTWVTDNKKRFSLTNMDGYNTGYPQTDAGNNAIPEGKTGLDLRLLVQANARCLEQAALRTDT